MTAKEINSIPFVFIVGMGRSGTTLLRTIMDAGEETIFAPEAKIIVHLKQKYNYPIIWTEKKVDEFLDDLYMEIKFATTWQIKREDLRAKILSYGFSEINFPFLIRLIYLTYPSNFEKKQIKVLGDKNPVYSLFIDEIKEIFPQAKFIHIVRDYRDCILSNKKVFKRQNAAALAQLWKIYNTIITIATKKYKDDFYFVRYEDLTADPEKSVRAICEFTGLTYHSTMLDFHKDLSAKLDKDINIVIHHTHPNLLKAVNQDRVGKWREELNDYEKDLISYLLNDYGNRFGYDKYENYSGKKYYFRAFTGFWINIADTMVIKGYFLTPFPIRKLIRKTSAWLFKKTGFFTVYNQGDVLKEVVKKKNAVAEGD